MPKDIKTKEKVIEKKTKGSVGKAADRAKIITAKTKDGVVEAKNKVQENTTADEQSPEQYAADEVTEGIQKGVEDAEIVTEKTVRTGVRKVKKKIKQRKQTPPKTRGELSVKKPKAEQQSVKYAHKADSKIKQTARSSANTKNTIKTAENSAKTVHKAEKTAQKSVEAAKWAKKAEEATKKTAQATAKTAKAVGKAVVEAAKATAAAVKELGAAIAAGGAPVVIIIIICLLIAVAGTCFGIFLSNDKTTGSQMTMTQAISQLTNDYYTDLESFKSNYTYDQYEIKTGSGNITIDWKTVLAVYAVKTTTSTEDAYEVVTMDDTKYELLKTVLYDMNPKSGEVTQKSVPIITVETDENGVSIKKTTYETKKVLTIHLIIAVKHLFLLNRKTKFITVQFIKI